MARRLTATLCLALICSSAFADFPDQVEKLNNGSYLFDPGDRFTYSWDDALFESDSKRVLKVRQSALVRSRLPYRPWAAARLT